MLRRILLLSFILLAPQLCAEDQGAKPIKVTIPDVECEFTLHTRAEPEEGTTDDAPVVVSEKLEPGWEGHVTLEFSNTTPLPAKIYANEGACQFLFLKGNEPCQTSYAERAGKYMGQRGVTLPKL